MSERKCKRCGTIEYGVWGYIGLAGWSMVFWALGYVSTEIVYFAPLSVIACMFGLILMLPMFFISYHENKEESEE